MIVCHEHRFIFIKTNKTAGTSVEIALSSLCSDADIITPVSFKDEERRRECGGHGPANFLAPWPNYGLNDWRRFLMRKRRKFTFYNHMPASEAKPLLGEDIWNSYFKFCFERNPWDRVVSYYYWHYRRRKRPSMSDFLESKRVLTLKERGIQLYTIDGEMAVDRVFPFEDIRGALNEVSAQIGSPEILEPPRTKSGTREEKVHYRDVLSDADRRRIAELFADEIRLFDYTF